ncbi:hypothetical protein C8F04DRAFT_64198 [Mycena alexandri]|uniref:Uncharacterized protein n=1 Tax=Mycena alexandri TaxID=1745969 RepID=A0AAD6SIW4_9AGAR|nr:hypothetical protein C8F04DRAFT_64198 [Mycena alexandri]
MSVGAPRNARRSRTFKRALVADSLESRVASAGGSQPAKKPEEPFSTLGSVDRFEGVLGSKGLELGWEEQRYDSIQKAKLQVVVERFPKASKTQLRLRGNSDVDVQGFQGERENGAGGQRHSRNCVERGLRGECIDVCASESLEAAVGCTEGAVQAFAIAVLPIEKNDVGPKVAEEFKIRHGEVCWIPKRERASRKERLRGHSQDGLSNGYLKNRERASKNERKGSAETGRAGRRYEPRYTPCFKGRSLRCAQDFP